MGGTYLALAVILGASAVAGQGLFALCGRHEWSWLAPAVGLAILCPACWGAVNLGGGAGWGLAALAALTAALAIAVFGAGRGAAPGARVGLLWVGLAVVAGAVLLGSLPFLVEGRFGILGTSLNPDMSQHLFAADRLLGGGQERLAAEGYPLGPHALVVAVSELGPSLVEAFGGLTLAIAVAACLSPLAVLNGLGRRRRVAAALLVGFAYMAASYLIQGAFKETMQALFVLAFAVGLHEVARGSFGGAAPAARWRSLAGLPLAALAVGSVYVYSFPGLTWIAGALGIWVLAELAAARDLRPLRRALVPGAAAVAALAVAAAPELGRIIDFANFETFNPDGAGLGNLFNPISPLEALGIWPSGDFRLDAGAGFAPVAAFWLGGLVGIAALAFGLAWWLRRGERALPAALGAATLLYLYALLGGTPYQEAKAIAIAAPLAMLISVRALLAAAPGLAAVGRLPARALAVPALAAAFTASAGACSVLALANGPVGPAQWGPGLIELREDGALGPGGEDGHDTLILAPEELLVDRRGEDLFLWELRGGRVCTGALPVGSIPRAPAGVENLVVYRGADSIEVRRSEDLEPGGRQCPFIADGARAGPGAGGAAE